MRAAASVMVITQLKFRGLLDMSLSRAAKGSVLFIVRAHDIVWDQFQGRFLRGSRVQSRRRAVLVRSRGVAEPLCNTCPGAYTAEKFTARLTGSYGGETRNRTWDQFWGEFSHPFRT